MLPNWIYRSETQFCRRPEHGRNYRAVLCSAKLFVFVTLITCNFLRRTIKERSVARDVQATDGQQNWNSSGFVQERATAQTWKPLSPQKSDFIWK